MIASPNRRGRHREATENDERIFEAAKRVFTDDPDAPIAAVGAEAGVGKSALYRRYPSKERLLQAVAEELTVAYVAIIEMAHRRLDAGDDGPHVLVAFLTEAVESETHALLLAITGRFEPTTHDRNLSIEGWRRGEDLVDRLHEAGALRADVNWLDLNKLLEGLNAIRSPRPDRVNMLRGRFAAVAAAGLAPAPDALPGVSAADDDFGKPAN